MAETILCAVDDSAAASRVLDIARALADAWGAELSVVHANGGPDQDVDRVVTSIRARLDGTRPAPDVRVLDGPPARAIMETADREGAALLVVGSRGRGSLRSAVLGSVSRELALDAPCPVVIVPPGERCEEATAGVEDADASVVCGVDGSDQALAAAAFAGRLAQRLGCRLVIVHARQNLRAVAAYPGASRTTPPLTGQDDAVQRLADKVVEDAEHAAGVSAVGVVEPGPPAQVLESVAARQSARFVVIAARGVGAVRAALLGSVAAELPLAAARPVVVLSAPAAAAAVRSGS
jgi:nucleotide-binding universal stress UspA family protein